MAISFLKQLHYYISWNYLRHRNLLLVFAVIQLIEAFAIVYGMSLWVSNETRETVYYLASGSLTLIIITVACVLAPQIINDSKQTGLFQYQRTLPVRRSVILISDIILWIGAAIPGILASIIAGILKFQVPFTVSFKSVLTLILVTLCLVLLGFSIAYWFSPNVMSMVTQLIMIFGLLFSPITYPAERLPEWLTDIYRFLPFVPASNLIRGELYQYGTVSIIDYIVVIIWFASMLSLTLVALNKQN